MIQNFHFNSERLFASSLEDKDAQKLFEIYSNSHAMRFRGTKPMEHLKDAKKMVEESRNRSPTKIRLGIRKKVENRLIGTLVLSQQKEVTSTIEIGFSFGKEYWGRGYAQEVLAAIEKELYKTNKYIELRAWCIKENYASVKIFQKFGYCEIKQEKYPQSLLFSKKIGVN